MGFAAGIIVFAVLSGIILRFLKLNIKLLSVVIILITFVLSAAVCFTKPVMHKQFSIDIIDYFVKINDDGSMSTVKQTTKTIIKKENKDTEK